LLTPRVGRGEAASEWLPAALAADSVALYMAAGASQQIAGALIGAGKKPATPAVLVESATWPGEQHEFTTLGELAATPRPPASGPVVLCVGEVFRDRAAAIRIAEHRLAG
jgi:uroporphyrin-III C-methyltransferase